MLKKLLLLTLLFALVIPVAAQEDDLTALSDEFESTASLENWQQYHAVEGWPDMIKVLEVEDGLLRLEPYTSGWYADYHAPFMFQEVTGDFVVTTRLKASGQTSDLPTEQWSLTGLMARAPRDITAETWEANGENWVFITTGIADRLNRPVFETKTTVNSDSRLRLHNARSGWLELRLARIGANFILLYRYEGEAEWVIQERFYREDMPETLQVGLVAYTDWLTADHLDPETFNTTLITDGTPDLVVEVDYIRFAPVNAPAEVVNLRSAAVSDVLAMLPVE